MLRSTVTLLFLILTLSFGSAVSFAESSGSPSAYINYDNAGNRASENSVSYAYTAGNELQVSATATYQYDSLGNTIGKNDWTYTWDSAGSLASASKPGTTVQFQYDPFGRRVGKTVNGTVHEYVYDGENIALEFVNGVIATQFIHGPATDEHLALVRDGQAYFYLTDALGSVKKITNQSGSVIQNYTYSLFGKVSASDSAFVQPFSFTGREYDSETGLHFYRARYLDPESGRFLSKDPIGFAGGDAVLWNCVLNNPTSLTDPSGNIPPFYLRWQILCGDRITT